MPATGVPMGNVHKCTWRYGGSNRKNSCIVKTPENRCTREPNRAAILDNKQFIDRHRLVLLRYLDGTAPASAEEPDALSYIENVLTEWHELFHKSDFASPGSEERTFWFALYQLEELIESPGPHIDPYEKFLMENLIEVRELLRHKRPLPEHRVIATRPDGT